MKSLPRFKRVKPLSEIKAKEHGWTLEVLNIVRRLGKAEFKNEDVYAFDRELETLHPDNRHIRDNPVNDTGRESASSFKSCATPVCYCTWSAVAGVCRRFYSRRRRRSYLSCGPIQNQR
jgi:hypothetical protein